MKKSTIWLIAGVMGFAFIGLLYLQTHYVHIILTNQEEQFRESVKRALYQVSHDLEIEETTKNINDPYLNFNKKYLRKDGKSSPKIQLGVDPIDISSGFGKNDITKTSKAIQDAFQNNYFYYQDLLDEVIQKAKKGSNKPLDERIDMKNIDDYIKTELENNNLNLPYTFSVSDHQKNIVYQSSNFHPETGKVYSQILFPQDSPNKLYVLQVIFPTQQKYM
ncbi:MAG: two-component sensor histidine kinase, partial [Dysgonamonadaceae bacterium]|nr:two-component sensor histidine kinase [Dysgonamonadaceae bacterium]